MPFLKNKLKTKNKWILDIDLDYFFDDNLESRGNQEKNDEYIKNFFDFIKKNLSNGFIEVLTISISPECSGGG